MYENEHLNNLPEVKGADRELAQEHNSLKNFG